MNVTKSKSHEDEYRLIMDALAESMLDLSDHDVETEFASEPLTKTKSIFQKASKQHAQTKLRVAKAQFESKSSAIRSSHFDIPQTAVERRSLLNALLASQHIATHVGLTAQFRELKNVPDSDVESTLRQLEALGVLQAFREAGK